MTREVERKPKLPERAGSTLSLIRQHIDQHGYAPTLRHIRDELDLSSTSVVARDLAILERLGYIRRDPDTARSIVLVEGDVVGQVELRYARHGGLIRYTSRSMSSAELRVVLVGIVLRLDKAEQRDFVKELAHYVEGGEGVVIPELAQVIRDVDGDVMK